MKNPIIKSFRHLGGAIEAEGLGYLVLRATRGLMLADHDRGEGGDYGGRALAGAARVVTLFGHHRIRDILHRDCIFEEIAMQVAKWGNSLAIRIPAAVVDALELKPGDEVVIRIDDERSFAVSRKPVREELLARLRAFRGKLPADFVFDREEANGR